MSWLSALLNDPGHSFPLVVIFLTVGLPTLGWVVISLTKVITKHRERIAMIEQGLDPDAHASRGESKLPP